MCLQMHISQRSLKRIWHLLMYNGWYAIKPNQTKQLCHKTKSNQTTKVFGLPKEFVFLILKVSISMNPGKYHIGSIHYIKFWVTLSFV